MKIRVIDHGVKQLPRRMHPDDCGLDVYALHDQVIEAGCSAAVPLGFGLALPVGYAAYIYPRSSQAVRGINCALSPVDPGYTGELHSLIQNTSHEAYVIHAGDRIGQLVVMPFMHVQLVAGEYDADERPARSARGTGWSGSTGK